MIWDKRVGQWVGQGLFNDPAAFKNYQSAGVIDRYGVLLGGVVFHNWQERAGTIEVSVFSASPRWLSRAVINEIMNYAFVGCGAQAVMAQTEAGNNRALKIWRALGSTEARIPRLFGRDRDGIVTVLTDDAWFASKYCEADYGQTRRTRTA